LIAKVEIALVDKSGLVILMS